MVRMEYELVFDNGTSGSYVVRRIMHKDVLKRRCFVTQLCFKMFLLFTKRIGPFWFSNHVPSPHYYYYYGIYPM